MQFRLFDSASEWRSEDGGVSAGGGGEGVHQVLEMALVVFGPAEETASSEAVGFVGTGG